MPKAPMPKAPMLKVPTLGACAPRAAHLRLQAWTCRALAAKATEHWVAASLTELAEDLLHRAIRAELAIAAEPTHRVPKRDGQGW